MLAPDRILLGNVLVLDSEGTAAQAIAIAGGRIARIGGKAEILEYRGPRTEVEDFGDATIIPGFNDTHAHSDSLGMKTLRPSLSRARSIEDVLAVVRQAAGEKPKGEWIITMPVGEPPYYWDGPRALAEQVMPTRRQLDSAAPEHPVLISSPSGYWGVPPCYMALNSLALERNGIGRSTTPRAAGIDIVRDDLGEPTGVIVERNFMQLADLDLLPAVPRFTFADRVEGLRRSLPMYHEKGTTSVYEGHGCAPDVIAAFRELWQRGELTLRSGLVVSPSWFSPPEARRAIHDYLPYARGRGFGDAMLRISGIFVAYGGDPVVTELVRRNIESIAWGGGIRQANSPDDFEEICMLAGENNLRVHTLASDRLHEIVPILERVAARYPIGERRWVIEHIAKARAADLMAIKRLGLGVTLIPAHYIWKVGARYLDMTPEEQDLLSPAKALDELGVPVSAATDAVPHDPLFCMWAMTARRERVSGRVVGEGGRVSNEAALRMLTVNGAWLTFEEEAKGPLLPGYLADLAVLSADPLAASASGLLEIRCKATMVGGQWVFRRRESIGL